MFEKIRLHGDKQQENYALGGLKAFTDFDGYTVLIEDIYEATHDNLHHTRMSGVHNVKHSGNRAYRLN